MTVDRQSATTNMARELEKMGFTAQDILSAQAYGATDVSTAIEYLNLKPEDKMADTSPHWNTSSTTEPVQYHSVSEPSPAFNSSSVNFSNFPPPAVTADNNAMSQSTVVMPGSEDDLQMVLALSRKQHEQDEQKKIQRAIELSKQGICAASEKNDPNVMRALQESIASNEREIEKRTVSWQSHAYAMPTDRLRVSVDDPVGLRNLGNTCYLNSLLQVYYHLPNFRKAIMSFRAPDHYMTVTEPVSSDSPSANNHEMPDLVDSNVNATSVSEPTFRPLFTEDNTSDNDDSATKEDAKETSKQNAIEFVFQLQRLFAFMALGNENCVDPTDVMRALRDSDGRPIVIGAQQDASEFNQLFLEMLEKGLSCDSSHAAVANLNISTRPPAAHPEVSVDIPAEASPEEIVKNMFTLKFIQEIKPCKTLTRNSTAVENRPVQTEGETTAVIVAVASKGERNLYGGLDDYAYTKVDYRGAEPVPSPSVDKPSYNGAPSGESKAVTGAEKESAVMVDVEEQNEATSAIKSVWFTRLPPVFVVYLQRTRYNPNTSQPEKVHDRYDFPAEVAMDRYMEVNRVASETANKEVQALRRRRKRVFSLLNQLKRFPDDSNASTETDGKGTGSTAVAGGSPEEFFSAGERVHKRLKEVLKPSSDLFAVKDLQRQDIEASLRTIEKLLEYDRQQCASFERELNSMKQESAIYRDLGKTRYFLHAVLVHDGAPDSGHYWTFIRNWNAIKSNEEWLRLSDSSVSTVTETEMFTYSLGGNSKASAYCLMYTAEPNVGRNEIAKESKSLLPQELLDEVERRKADMLREAELVQEPPIMGPHLPPQVEEQGS